MRVRKCVVNWDFCQRNLFALWMHNSNWLDVCTRTTFHFVSKVKRQHNALFHFGNIRLCSPKYYFQCWMCRIGRFKFCFSVSFSLIITFLQKSVRPLGAKYKFDSEIGLLVVHSTGKFMRNLRNTWCICKIYYDVHTPQFEHFCKLQ